MQFFYLGFVLIILLQCLTTDIDLGEYIGEDRVVNYLSTLWKDPALDLGPLLTPEMVKRSCKSELGYDAICQDIFNHMKLLFFANDESLTYNGLGIWLFSFPFTMICNASNFPFVQAYNISANMEKF